MKTRNYGIDFLRMISMIMIVMLHTLGHGGILRSVSFLSVHYQIAWLLEVIAFGAVNTYAMISGFVSVDSHFKISNILILWLQVLFYGILINTVFFFLLPESRNTSGWIQALFPVTRKEYWYFTAYAGVFFLSPFINQMFRNLSEKQIKTLFCFTLVVFSVVPTISQTFTPQQDVFYMGDGYSVFWLTLMYCSRSKFLSKLLKTFDKTFREIFPVFISTKRREKPSAFFDNNFVNNAYFSEAASSSSSHLASSSSKAPISSRMTCLCLWSS